MKTDQSITFLENLENFYSVFAYWENELFKKPGSSASLHSEETIYFFNRIYIMLTKIYC